MFLIFFYEGERDYIHHFALLPVQYADALLVYEENVQFCFVTQTHFWCMRKMPNFVLLIIIHTKKIKAQENSLYDLSLRLGNYFDEQANRSSVINKNGETASSKHKNKTMTFFVYFHFETNNGQSIHKLYLHKFIVINVLEWNRQKKWIMKQHRTVATTINKKTRNVLAVVSPRYQVFGAGKKQGERESRGREGKCAL